MQNKLGTILLLLAAGICLPLLSSAQDKGLAGDIGALQLVLQKAYDDMIVHSSELIGLARGIAGFGTLLFISVRVWKNIARAEGVDVFPLLRPFAIGLTLILYPSLIALLNGIMQPTVSGTAALVQNSNQAVATLLQQKEDALKNSSEWQMFTGPTGSGDLQKWEDLSGEADSGVFAGISNRMKFEMAKVSYNMKNSVKVWLSEILEVLFESAALCINTIRTFNLIVLAILGPLALSLSVFDGFSRVLNNWLSKYINVFLWLPIANIFGSLISQIQQEMIKLDIAQLNSTGQTTFGPTDTAYLIFLIMGIAGYFTVPFIANTIVHAGGNVGDLATNRINRWITIF